MTRRQKYHRLLALIGPTASGKSVLAAHAAEVLNGEIVNCDSMQVYRFLNIGTAKPSQEQKRKIPHHLYDVADPNEFFSAGRYMAEAREVCQEVAARGKIPLVVGGTGLYLRALLEGVFEGPGRSPQIRERLYRVGSRKGFDYLHRLLQKVDPGAAGRIQQADAVRIVRALEVYFLTGKPITELQPRREPLTGFAVLKVGLDLSRPFLYDRINRRVREMFETGLIEEVRDLLEKGCPTDCKAFEALGYRRAVAVLTGKLGRAEAVELTQRDTRRYAKRQMTWFRKEKDVHWISYPGEDPEALAELLEVVRKRWQYQ